MRKLAVFDIDGTIFRSSLLIELMEALVSEKIFPLQAQKDIEEDYRLWLNREGEYEQYIKQVVVAYRKYIASCKEEDVVRVVDLVLESEKKKVYRYTRDLIYALQKKGYFLLAISGSPGHILTSFAKDIGFDKYLGSYYEVVDGKFTGREPYGNPANDKRKTFLEFIKKSDEVFDLASAIGVGDTESDIAFLKMVGQPIAFNPNKNLAKHARKKKWRIIVERKDVIYEVEDFRFLD